MKARSDTELHAEHRNKYEENQLNEKLKDIVKLKTHAFNYHFREYKHLREDFKECLKTTGNSSKGAKPESATEVKTNVNPWRLTIRPADNIQHFRGNISLRYPLIANKNKEKRRLERGNQLSLIRHTHMHGHENASGADVDAQVASKESHNVETPTSEKMEEHQPTERSFQTSSFIGKQSPTANKYSVANMRASTGSITTANRYSFANMRASTGSIKMESPSVPRQRSRSLSCKSNTWPNDLKMTSIPELSVSSKPVFDSPDKDLIRQTNDTKIDNKTPRVLTSKVQDEASTTAECLSSKNRKEEEKKETYTNLSLCQNDKNGLYKNNDKVSNKVIEQESMESNNNVNDVSFPRIDIEVRPHTSYQMKTANKKTESQKDLKNKIPRPHTVHVTDSSDAIGDVKETTEMTSEDEADEQKAEKPPPAWLQNYIKPQERYKVDSLLMKRTGRLKKRLSIDVPLASVDTVEPVRLRKVFSKSAKQREYNRLVEENEKRKHKTQTLDLDSDIQFKIDKFLQSLDNFIGDNSPKTS